ncbi:phosphatase PAP2 family protein [Methylobacterium fujisawaense]
MLEDPILYWNAVASEVQGRDYMPLPNAMGVLGIDPQQAGPTRSSRALAMVHIAMYDAYALTAGAPRLEPHTATGTAPGGASAEAAVASAAASLLSALFPRQATFVSNKLFDYVAQLATAGQAPSAVGMGSTFGGMIASEVNASRAGDLMIVSSSDGADMAYVFAPGHHQPDPYMTPQGRHASRWGQLQSFCAAPSTTSFMYDHADFLDAPPDWNGGADYTKDFKEVKKEGAFITNSRSPEEMVIAMFWAYDGAWSIGTPPRLYNQCIQAVVETLHDAGTPLDTAQLARLFALVNVGMADAGIIAWQAKYHYDLWRPVVGIRQHDEGYGPDHGSGRSLPLGDPFWRPLGLPATNQPGRFNTTPNFPAYPSGHASFGTTCFELVRLFLDGEGINSNVTFKATSDELNGAHRDADGSIRTKHIRELDLATAIKENILSRVYLGVHWRFDGEGKGTKLGYGGKAIGVHLAPKVINGCFKKKVPPSV